MEKNDFNNFKNTVFMESKIKEILVIMKKIISNGKKLDLIKSEELEDLINFYKKKLNHLLITNIKCNSQNTNLEELDFIIILYCNIYDSWKDFLIGKKFFDEKFGITSTLLLKEILGDFIAIRNLYALGLENQQNSLIRNQLEKFRIFFLINCDLNFREEFINNKSNLTSKKLYEKYTKPSMQKKHLKKYSGNTNLLSIACELLSSENTNEHYSFLSKFVHNNENKFYLDYYLKNNKYDISNTDYKSDYIDSRIKRLIETSVYLLAPTINLLNLISEEKENMEKEVFFNSYSLVIFKERYNI